MNNDSRHQLIFTIRSNLTSWFNCKIHLSYSRSFSICTHFSSPNFLFRKDFYKETSVHFGCVLITYLFSLSVLFNDLFAHLLRQLNVFRLLARLLRKKIKLTEFCRICLMRVAIAHPQLINLYLIKSEQDWFVCQFEFLFVRIL